MRAEKREFQRFVSQSDIVFVIPVYQRNYDWKKGNCKQLFDDIIENLRANNVDVSNVERVKDVQTGKANIVPAFMFASNELQ